MSDLSLHVSVKVTWVAASVDANVAGAAEIEPPHLLLAVLRLADGMCGAEVSHLHLEASDLAALSFSASAARRALGLDEATTTQVRRHLQHTIRGEGVMPHRVPALHRSSATRSVFDAAARTALKAGDTKLTVVHLIEALAAQGLVQAAIDGSPLPEITDAADRSEREAGPVAGSQQRNPGSLGRDLTALAQESRLRPIVGRDNEIKQLARRLQRTTKRNSLVIGDAGVGKTAVVEGLAVFCASEEAPNALRGIRILEVSIGDLMAGTRYRGDLEERVQDLVARLEADPDLVAFLDEVHLVVARQGEEAPTIANLLKPVLDDDRVRCIAATTTEEYELHVKQDSAFARRFGRPIVIREPGRDVARLILETWKERIESVHSGLRISDEAVDAALDLAIAHIPDRRLPDKAIDLLDDAATFALLPTIHQVSNGAPSKESLTMGREQVEAVLREQHGIDVALSGADGSRLAKALEAELVGQSAAAERVVTTLASARRSADSGRPLSVLLFTGPTGVGKTYTAELVAAALYGTAGSLCRLSMNEYRERHEIGRLTGAPPGFIGHERPGALFAFVEGHPEGVVLLDEIEKAHPEVLQYFLQIFDTGEALDSRGRRVSFSPYVFVMTSNALTQPPRPLGFAKSAVTPGDLASEEDLRQALARLLSPEFVARVDAVVSYEPLSLEALDELLDRSILETVQLLEKQDGVRLEVSDEARESLGAACHQQKEGARGVRRLVERELIGALAAAEAGNSDDSEERDRGLRLRCWLLDVRDGRLVLVSKPRS